jgi:hypothetical protein
MGGFLFARHRGVLSESGSSESGQARFDLRG